MTNQQNNAKEKESDAHAPLVPLPSLLVEKAVQEALREDLGDAGDITTNATIGPNTNASVNLTARDQGRIAGLDLAKSAFHQLDPKINFETLCGDGHNIGPGQIIARINGSARAILTAERVALNFLGHLSGIATATQNLARAITAHKAKICCTRKTTPGLRAFEKYAVRAGGGVNHRFGLYDGILIKDNHIALAGGLTQAVTRARAAASHMAKIEVEVDTLSQLEEALTHPIDAVLLDNMDPATLARAVHMISGRVLAEASGGITLQSVEAIAASGVDLISVGGITHSAPCLDIGLDFEAVKN